MARKRKMDAQDAVPAAMLAFWQHGYQALGTRQLETETGITRFTLQTAYGGKMRLFEQALDAYLDQMEQELLPAMNDGTLEGLARWFEVRCNPEITPEAGQWGCLMIASINEFGDTVPEVSARAERFEHMLRAGFVKALDCIKASGGLAQSVEPDAAAETLMAASIGLNVMIRAKGSCAAGAGMAAGIAALVRSWGPIR